MRHSRDSSAGGCFVVSDAKLLCRCQLRVLFAGPRPAQDLGTKLAAVRTAARHALELLQNAGVGDDTYEAAVQADGMLQRAEVARLAYLALQVWVSRVPFPCTPAGVVCRCQAVPALAC